MKQLIILGGGFMQLPLIRKAREMGYVVIVLDGNPDAPGLGPEYSSAPVVCNIADAEACVSKLQMLREQRELNHVQGVITAGTDMSHSVAMVAEQLGLPGIKPEDALAATNKVLMRKRLAAHNIYQPRFVAIWRFPELHQAMDQIGLPLVLKPARNMGARGVVLIRKREEIYKAWQHSRKYSKSGELILEEYIAGDELSLDALAWQDSQGQQHFRLCGIADRIIGGEPYFIESGHTMPSQKEAAKLQAAEAALFAAMRALGITQGAAKGDIRIDSRGQIAIGEVAARLSGGFMSSHTYPYHSGVDLLGNAIRIACGETPLELDPSQNLVSIERAIIGSPGKITALGGQTRMESIKHINHVFIMKKPGDILSALDSNIGKLGHIIASAPDLASAENAIAEARQHLELEIDDSYGIDWDQIAQTAREKFGTDICHVCKACDGQNCASGMPGMGAVGSMETFKDNSLALAEIKLRPSYIHGDLKPSSRSCFLGYELAAPIMTAPMTGAVTNMGGAISDYDLSRILLEACDQMGSLAWLGDGASPDRYLEILRAVADSRAPAVLICKPRVDLDAIQERFNAAKKCQVLALGMDIDALSLKTLVNRQKKAMARDAIQLQEIRQMTNLPFVLKGVMTVTDALKALEIGANAIVVSNHGGRVLDQMPGTARVLPEIANAVAGQIPVLVDGGVRSGLDVFKMLALGANGVLFGRMAAIAAVGGGPRAVKYLLREYQEELLQAMQLNGISTLKELNHKLLYFSSGTQTSSPAP